MDNLRTKRNSQKLKVTENTSGGVMAEEKVQVYAPGSVYPRFVGIAVLFVIVILALRIMGYW